MITLGNCQEDMEAVARSELRWSPCQKGGTEHIFFLFHSEAFLCFERKCQVLTCTAGKNCQCRTGQTDTPSTCREGSHALSIRPKQVQWEIKARNIFK